MQRIYKSSNNTKLLQYHASLTKEQRISSSGYAGFPDKKEDDCESNIPGNLRKQLLEEQGYICCYCMTRISCHGTKIEHFKDQSNNRNLQLKFSNLFIACLGNEGNSNNVQHCDTFKGDKSLLYINLTSNIENHIKYSSRGMISSSITTLNDDINNILNLNTKPLKDTREQRLETLILAMIKKYGKTWKKQNIETEIEKYKSKTTDGKYREYCQMFIYYLTKKARAC